MRLLGKVLQRPLPSRAAAARTTAASVASQGSATRFVPQTKEAVTTGSASRSEQATQQWRRYVIEFVDSHRDFRMAELKAVAEMLNVDWILHEDNYDTEVSELEAKNRQLESTLADLEDNIRSDPNLLNSFPSLRQKLTPPRAVVLCALFCFAFLATCTGPLSSVIPTTTAPVSFTTRTSGGVGTSPSPAAWRSGARHGAALDDAATAHDPFRPIDLNRLPRSHHVSSNSPASAAAAAWSSSSSSSSSSTGAGKGIGAAARFGAVGTGGGDARVAALSDSRRLHRDQQQGPHKQQGRSFVGRTLQSVAPRETGLAVRTDLVLLHPSSSTNDDEDAVVVDAPYNGASSSPSSSLSSSSSSQEGAVYPLGHPVPPKPRRLPGSEHLARINDVLRQQEKQVYAMMLSDHHHHQQHQHKVATAGTTSLAAANTAGGAVPSTPGAIARVADERYPVLRIDSEHRQAVHEAVIRQSDRSTILCPEVEVMAATFSTSSDGQPTKLSVVVPSTFKNGTTPHLLQLECEVTSMAFIPVDSKPSTVPVPSHSTDNTPSPAR